MLSGRVFVRDSWLAPFAASDHINLTTNVASTGNTAALAVSTAQNGGADTLITLHDGSTIYLVGVSYSIRHPCLARVPVTEARP